MTNIIFVGGAHGRSGTNIMKRLLCTHPRVSWVLGDETRYMEFLAELLPHLLGDTAYLPRNAGLAFNRFRENIVKHFGDRPSVCNLLQELESCLASTTINVPRFGRLPLIESLNRAQAADILGTFTQQLFNQAMLAPKAHLACEKTPSNSQYITMAHSMLPQARMIVMIRHPLDTALSFLPPDWGPNDPIDAAHYTHTYHTRWRVASCRVPETFYQVVKLQDLIHQPETQLHRIGEFIGLEWHEATMMKAFELLRTPQNRRDTVSPLVRQQMLEILAEDMTYYNSLGC